MGADLQASCRHGLPQSDTDPTSFTRRLGEAKEAVDDISRHRVGDVLGLGLDVKHDPFGVPVFEEVINEVAMSATPSTITGCRRSSSGEPQPVIFVRRGRPRRAHRRARDCSLWGKEE